MQEHTRPLEVFQKSDPQARAFAGARNQTWDVGQYEAASEAAGCVADLDYAQVWDECRERVIGNLRTGATHRTDQCALADVGEPEQTDVREHLQLETQRALHARCTWLGLAGCAVDGRGEMYVAPTTVAALRD